MGSRVLPLRCSASLRRHGRWKAACSIVAHMWRINPSDANAPSPFRPVSASPWNRRPHSRTGRYPILSAAPRHRRGCAWKARFTQHRQAPSHNLGALLQRVMGSRVLPLGCAASRRRKTGGKPPAAWRNRRDGAGLRPPPSGRGTACMVCGMIGDKQRTPRVGRGSGVVVRAGQRRNRAPGRGCETQRSGEHGTGSVLKATAQYASRLRRPPDCVTKNR